MTDTFAEIGKLADQINELISEHHRSNPSWQIPVESKEVKQNQETLPGKPKFRWAPGEAERETLLPVRHEDIWKFRKTLEALHWVAQEVDLTRDRRDWETRMTADERHFVAHQLGFFAGADLWVLKNLSDNFGEEVDCLEARAVFAGQADQENTHAEAYVLQAMAVLDGAELARVLAAARAMPAVAQMRAWAYRWFDRAIPLGERMVAWAMFEGVLFSASFASLQWLRDRNLLPGITDFNTMIARDEGVHTLHLCLLLREYLIERPAAAKVREIVAGAIATLDGFVTESLPVRLIGINAELMKQYVRFQADCVVATMGYPPAYGVANPFESMDKLSLNGVAKTNFFERRALQYQNVSKAGAARLAIDDTPVEVPE
jgi:ribonucleotide reductase beta subunit family protein with ferritin-like domain